MNKLNRKSTISIIVTIVFALIVGYTVIQSNSNEEKKFLQKYDLDNLTVQEMVTYLDNKVDEDEGFRAGITATTFSIGDDYNRYTYDVPKDQFYLSLAPYINTTHPCGNHNLVTCRGELKNETMNVVVTDSSGNVIIDDDYTSFNNGFIGLWLPKDMTGTITVNYQGLTTTGEVSTFETSGTCMTTLKLT